jgi:hypothetical protein
MLSPNMIAFSVAASIARPNSSARERSPVESAPPQGLLGQRSTIKYTSGEAARGPGRPDIFVGYANALLALRMVAAVIFGDLVSPAKAAPLATTQPIERNVQAMLVEEVGYSSSQYGSDGRGYGYRVPCAYYPGYYPPPNGYHVPYVYYRPYYATPWFDPYERPYFATPWVALPGQ